jgi:hypothetical protein
MSNTKNTTERNMKLTANMIQMIRNLSSLEDSDADYIGGYCVSASLPSGRDNTEVTSMGLYRRGLAAWTNEEGEQVSGNDCGWMRLTKAGRAVAADL